VGGLWTKGDKVPEHVRVLKYKFEDIADGQVAVL